MKAAVHAYSWLRCTECTRRTRSGRWRVRGRSYRTRALALRSMPSHGETEAVHVFDCPDGKRRAWHGGIPVRMAQGFANACTLEADARVERSREAQRESHTRIRHGIELASTMDPVEFNAWMATLHPIERVCIREAVAS